MSAVDTAIVEIEQELAALAPIHEGLRDYARLNLSPETMAEVQEAIVIYDRRFALLNAALVNSRALQTDGYPAIPIQDVMPAVYADLRTNKDTIDAALARFAATAGSLNLSAGSPETKVL